MTLVRAALAGLCMFVLAGGSAAAPPAPVTVDLGASTAVASFLNEAGQVAGTGPAGAFIWSERDGLVTLGNLGGNRPPLLAGINENGQVVGRIWLASGSYDAFSWTPEGGVVDIGGGGGYSAAMGVSDTGLVAGWMLNGPSHRAFVWSNASGVLWLGALRNGSSDGMAVNNPGQVVGGSVVSSTPAESHAFLWTQAVGLRDLGTLGGRTGYAQAVNDAGQVVGYSTTAAGDLHGFAWTAERGMVDLGTLGGSESSAAAVSEAGQVVGYGTTAAGARHAFSWTRAGGMIDLGTLGGTTSQAAAVSDTGQVVGSSTTASGETHAFSWTPADGMVDLGTLGGSKSEALDVNGAGEVAGYALTAGGEQHAVVWQTAGTSAQAAPSIPDLAAASDDGTSSTDNITSSATLELTGSAAPGVTVTLYRGGAEAGTATAGKDGAWVVSDTAPGPGTYCYTARATDAAGAVSAASGALSVTVVGPFSTAGLAYAATDLGSLNAWPAAANPHGQVVGYVIAESRDPRAFSWTPRGGLVLLGTLGGTMSYARAVTPSGEVFGVSATATGGTHLFRWTAASGMVDLGGASAGGAGVAAVNDDGQAVGVFTPDSGAVHGYSWAPATGFVDLGTLGGTTSDARAVDGGGRVFGTSTSASGELHAFMWSAAGGMVDLGRIGQLGGGSSSSIDDVSDNGNIVGTFTTPSGLGHGFLWSVADGFVDLGQVTPQAVNDAGQVAGRLENSAGGGDVFWWSRATGLVDGGNLGGPTDRVYRVVLSESGDVAGSMGVPRSIHVFFWRAPAGVVDLGGAPPGTWSDVIAVTASGDVYGWSAPDLGAGPGRHVVLWRTSGRDSVPPVLSVPASVTSEARSGGGAAVTYAVAATDDTDPAPAVVCTPPSGSKFPLGETPVACTATDASGNVASARFVVNVVDTTAPWLTAPDEVVVDANSPAGAVAEFATSAYDLVDPRPELVCTPPSGSVFPAGSTLVKCTATDHAGNAQTATFAVEVRGAADQLDRLASLVRTAEMDRSLRHDLSGRLNRARRTLGSPPAACRQLVETADRIWQELGSPRSSLDTATADQLLGALTVEEALGCLPSESSVPSAARDTVRLVEAINGLAASGGWVRDLRAMAAELGSDVTRHGAAVVAQQLGAIDGAIRTDTASGRLAPPQAAQLHALVAQVGADLGL